MLDGRNFKSQMFGEGEGTSEIRSKNCEVALLGCWDADDTDHQPVLFFVCWDDGLRGMAWEAVFGLG